MHFIRGSSLLNNETYERTRANKHSCKSAAGTFRGHRGCMTHEWQAGGGRGLYFHRGACQPMDKIDAISAPIWKHYSAGRKRGRCGRIRGPCTPAAGQR